MIAPENVLPAYDTSVAGLLYESISERPVVDHYRIAAEHLVLAPTRRFYAVAVDEDNEEARKAGALERSQQQEALASWLYAHHPELALDAEIIVRSRIHVEANSQARRYYYLKLKKRNAR